MRHIWQRHLPLIAKTCQWAVWQYSTHGLMWHTILGASTCAYLVAAHSLNVATCAGHLCDSVKSDQWSVVLGIPLPAIGLTFFCCVYVLLQLLSIVSHPAKHLLVNSLLRSLCLLGLVAASILAIRLVIVLHAVCPWCILSHLNVASVFCFAYARKPTCVRTSISGHLITALIICLPAILVGFSVTRSTLNPVCDLRKLNSISLAELMPSDLHTILGQGSFSVIYFGDLQCTYCHRYFETVKDATAANGGSFSYRHYLVPGHDDALSEAVFLEATSATSFWPLLTNTMQQPTDSSLKQAIVDDLPNLSSASIYRARAYVMRDQALAISIGIKVAPCVIILHHGRREAMTADQFLKRVESFRSG